ncbi:Fic family protein [Paenibacillus koleovorans]|uniref:Fic family protein n=1 Tax=Paenibacillus koleovorans TaxID=121608 RepID=UPI000FDA0BB0|nr:Fic family protein [Paenibacillus koleovorans]
MTVPLTASDIRDIHNEMVRRYGGLNGEYEPGLIDFMAGKPFDGFGELEYYPGLFIKAAIYGGFCNKTTLL